MLYCNLSTDEQDPDYSVDGNEADYSDGEESDSESDLEDACPLSSEQCYACDENTFIEYESKLKELFKYCQQCGSPINQGLMRKSKNTGSQLTLHIKCEKGKFTFYLLREK